MITAKQMRRHLRYDPKTGLLWWKIRGPHRSRNKPAGTFVGRWYVGIFGKHWIVSRVIWLIKTGKWPKQYLDHINGNPFDNRWSNLREVTPHQNASNCKVYKNNKSGFKGVSWITRDQKYSVYIQVKNKRIALGHFDCPVQAHRAYIKAAKHHFGEFARAS